MSRKKLSVWAKEQGVHYRTALAWVSTGTMPVPIERTPGGHIRVLDDSVSLEQKTDLVRQMDHLCTELKKTRLELTKLKVKK